MQMQMEEVRTKMLEIDRLRKDMALIATNYTKTANEIKEQNYQTMDLIDRNQEYQLEETKKVQDEIFGLKAKCHGQNEHMEMLEGKQRDIYDT